jgi:tetratricopeptide (TPR) repeat protein
VIVVVSVVSALFLAKAVQAQLTSAQVLASSVEKPGPELADVDKAIAVFYKGDAMAAREMLVAIRDRQPSLAPVDVLMSLLHLSVNRRADAEASLAEAIAKHRDDPEPYLILGDLSIRENRPIVAELAYDKARELLADYKTTPWRVKSLTMRTYAGLASLCESRSQFKQAADHLQAWLKLDPKNPLARGSLGRVRFRLGDVAGARAAFEELLRIDPHAPPADIAMGRLYTDEGKLDEARKSMEAALKSHGKDIRTQLTIGDWALTTGFVDLAQKCTDAVLAADKTSLGGQVLSARLARQAGKLDQAKAILTAAVLKYPNEFALTNELARVLAMSSSAEQHKTGFEYAKSAFFLHRDRSTAIGREAALTYAWLLMLNEKPAEAEAALHTLPDGSPVSSENAYIAAQVYAKRGRPELALNALRAALNAPTPFPNRSMAEAMLKDLEREPTTKATAPATSASDRKSP